MKPLAKTFLGHITPPKNRRPPTYTAVLFRFVLFRFVSFRFVSFRFVSLQSYCPPAVLLYCFTVLLHCSPTVFTVLQSYCPTAVLSYCCEGGEHAGPLHTCIHACIHAYGHIIHGMHGIYGLYSNVELLIKNFFFISSYIYDMGMNILHAIQQYPAVSSSK